MEITSKERETPSPHPTPPPTPTLNPRSQEINNNNNNAHPTTFVQADTSSFKQVVQMLTGASKTATNNIPPIKNTLQKKQGHKLYERRNSLKNGLMINTMAPGYELHRKHEILSPSILDFPSLVLSPVTPMIEDNLSKLEEKAIAEKKFYLLPSPRTNATTEEPRLLPLFPVTSPRV